MKIYKIALSALLLAAQLPAQAQWGAPNAKSILAAQQRTSFNMLKEGWSAAWIEVPDSQRDQYGVYYFRKDINLNAQPSQFKVYVSADQRYKLYVNGHLASLGPARNDSKHWNYETVDLAPYLKSGKNVVAAQVWSEGRFKPVPNATIQVGFILMGEGDSKVLHTDGTWKCIQDPSYTPLRQSVPGYYALGAGEGVDMNQYIADWMDPDNTLEGWKDAKPYAMGAPHDDSSGTGVYSGHPLVPSTLPQVERTYQRLNTVRKDGGIKLPKGFPAQQGEITVPAHQKVDILLDQNYLTNGFFTLNMSKGAQAKVKIQYAESLYTGENGNKKGNRNEVEGKRFVGRFDEITSNGKDNQSFTTLDWRTWRYVNLHIETQDEPLVLNDVYGTFVGYPFQLKAKLDTDNQELQKMMEIGWRTARLCAIETYTDCPFYEQLQYLGDTRIQALVSLYNTGDDRLMKNYLRQADMSRNAEGITMGRAPSELPQYITPYALHYIYALHDYMMYGADQDFVFDLVPGAEQILHYFSRYTLPDGRVSGLPGWNFTDWCYNKGWQMGVPQPAANDGGTSILDLQLLYAYQMLGDMEQRQGNAFMAKQYADKAAQLTNAINKAYWVESKGLYANNTDKNQFSQHAQALAILCGLADGSKALDMANKMLTDETLDYCTVYFKFYLHQALTKVGLGDDYLKWLDIWRENISMGLTTWGETSDVDGTRSDCHAWGASPNIEFFRTLLGIDSASPAFKTVKIEPHLGDIKKIGGSMPHPQGEITVAYEYKKDGKGKKAPEFFTAEIELPAQVSGSFVWAGKTYPLHEGKNSIEVK
ncbi:MAG: alpha-L-rhamnosidase N-terminal domain-containing protein [Bacteroidaceae bacterium]|nr:alpha-L-rhamnosidase N-terminal domain-containing protein [Bacteroidaceae bacterium]